MPNPARLREIAELDSLKQVLADSEEQRQAMAAEQRHLIPVDEVHAELDRLNLPRHSPTGRPWVISERFAILRMRLDGER